MRVYNCSVTVGDGYGNKKKIYYRGVTNLVSMVRYFDETFGKNWLWVNVYQRVKKSSNNGSSWGRPLGSFTKRNRPNHPQQL